MAVSIMFYVKRAARLPPVLEVEDESSRLSPFTHCGAGDSLMLEDESDYCLTISRTDGKIFMLV